MGSPVSRDRHFDFWTGTPGAEGCDLTPKSQGWGARGVSQLLPVAPEGGVEVGVELRRGRWRRGRTLLTTAVCRWSWPPVRHEPPGARGVQTEKQRGEGEAQSLLLTGRVTVGKSLL